MCEPFTFLQVYLDKEMLTWRQGMIVNLTSYFYHFHLNQVLA